MRFRERSFHWIVNHGVISEIGRLFSFDHNAPRSLLRLRLSVSPESRPLTKLFGRFIFFLRSNFKLIIASPYLVPTLLLYCMVCRPRLWTTIRALLPNMSSPLWLFHWVSWLKATHIIVFVYKRFDDFHRLSEGSPAIFSTWGVNFSNWN